MDAFDADVLIYAATPHHPLGRRVANLFQAGDIPAGTGSLLLLPEVLSKPIRDRATDETTALLALLGRLELLPLDAAMADLAVSLAATYRLQAADAVHLASAVAVGADRFLTNNRGDFPKTISEVDVTYPDELPAP